MKFKAENRLSTKQYRRNLALAAAAAAAVVSRKETSAAAAVVVVVTTRDIEKWGLSPIFNLTICQCVNAVMEIH